MYRQAYKLHVPEYNMAKPQTTCQKCKNEEVIKRGFKKTENRGNLQRYTCKSCGLRPEKMMGFLE
jgi:transposase-like protein